MPLFEVNNSNTPQITKLVNSVKPTDFDRISSPANNVAQRVNENKQTFFSNNARGAEAVLNNISAASLSANRTGRDLFLSLLESNISEGNNLRSIIRQSLRDPEIERFNPETSKQQLFRMDLNEIQASVNFPTQQLQQRAYAENALETTRPTDDRFADFALA